MRVISKLRSFSPQVLLASGGGLLLLGGAILLVVLMAASSDGTTEPPLAERPDTTAVEGSASGESAAMPTSTSSTLAVALGPDGRPLPSWKQKQEEARQKQQAQEDAAVAAEDSPSTTTAPSSSQSPSNTSTTAPSVTTRSVGTGGSTSLYGVWGGTAGELAGYLTAANPAPRFTVPTLTLAQYYIRYAAEVKLRADVLWAQMIHETGYGKYGGSVKPEQNNFAGIGATGGGVPGHTFPTAERGVQAHVAHMAAYAYSYDVAPWTNAATDPRYDAVNPRGIARVLRDLDGRWAVPGIGYGARIERHLLALNP